MIKNILLTKIILVALMLFNVNNAAYANMGTYKISQIMVGGYTNNGVQGYRVFLKTNHNNPKNCSRKNAVVILADDPNFDALYTILLAAQTAGNSVSFWSPRCDAKGEYTVVQRVSQKT